MTTMTEHANIVLELVLAAQLKPHSVLKGDASISVLVAADGRNPQWLQARLAKEALKRGIQPFGITFSYPMDQTMRLEFFPAEIEEVR